MRLLEALLSLFWIAIAYVGLVQAAKRFFGGRYRPETAAVAVIIAFIVGVNWPRPTAVTVDATTATATATASPTPVTAHLSPSTATKVADVGAACGTAHLVKDAGKGSLDTAQVRGRAAVEAVAREIKLRETDVLIVQGWAANPDAKGPAASVCTIVDGKILPGLHIFYGGNRPDVATAFNDSAMMATGYVLAIPAAKIKVGHHVLRAAAVASDGSAALMPGSLEVVVSRAAARSS